MSGATRSTIVLLAGAGLALSFGFARAEPDSTASLPATVVTETQVPLDRSGRVMRMDEALARALGMLDRYPGFQEARLFQRSDSTFVFEVSTIDRGGLARQRVPLSPSEADSLRGRVEQAIRSGRSGERLNQSGRPLFVTMTTVMGLGFYGWAVPVLAEVEGGETFSGVYLLTAGAATVLPLMVLHDRSISDADAILWTYGVTRGTVHGSMAAFLGAEDPEGKVQLAYAMGFSLAEGIAGFAWASHSHMRAGTAGTYVTGGDVGMLYGLGFAELGDVTNSSRATSMLLGSGIGLAAAGLLDRHRDYSYGDGAVMRMAGWLGGYAAVAAASLSSQDPSSDTYISCAMLGGLVGLASGDLLVRHAEFTFGQSIVIDATTIGGGLMGLGVGLVSNGSGSTNEDAVLLAASSIGSLLGFAFGYGMNVSSAQENNANRSSSWRLDLTPTPPLTPRRPHGRSARDQHHSAGRSLTRGRAGAGLADAPAATPAARSAPSGSRPPRSGARSRCRPRLANLSGRARPIRGRVVQPRTSRAPARA